MAGVKLGGPTAEVLLRRAYIRWGLTCCTPDVLLDWWRSSFTMVSEARTLERFCEDADPAECAIARRQGLCHLHQPPPAPVPWQGTAEDWLRLTLQEHGGALAVATINREARAVGVSVRQLRKVAARIGVDKGAGTRAGTWTLRVYQEGGLCLANPSERAS